MMTELHKEVVLALGDRQVEKHKRYGEWRMAPASVVSYIPSARKPDGTTDWAHVDEAGKVLDELVEMGLVSTQEAVNFGRPGKQYGLTDEGWTLYRDLEKQREDAHAKLVRTGLYRRTILAVGDEQLESKQSSGKWEMAWWHTCKLPDEAEEAMWKLVAIGMMRHDVCKLSPLRRAPKVALTPYGWKHYWSLKKEENAVKPERSNGMVTVYTAAMWVLKKHPEWQQYALDITVKSGDKAFAPTWEMVIGVKNGTMSHDEYERQYRELMRDSYRKHREVWKDVLSRDKVVLTCYCRPGEFCHRHLLAKYLEACGAVYGGELEP